ncbi:hypothetical protein PBCV1_a099aL [Paramecium bursaria Chlorella virus 1]|uniref:Uncharacterized protein n=1 Tax=Paramecium bursaria Chlorella virus 1 TaxID=10506 RepID=F8TTX8_PBCV1|nr:hypothetical protein PBCV1_a099aL [Paramecium bursaria Chlorella virus 1]AEI70039.1 hypothetical protein [Paramecium bursaria Chlorella virus 1]
MSYIALHYICNNVDMTTPGSNNKQEVLQEKSHRLSIGSCIVQNAILD